MKWYWINSPKWLSYVLTKRLWHINTSSKVIYLTFDDGPTPGVTNFVLDCLKQYNAKATFFCVGNNAKKHPYLFNRIVNEKHQIGNHTQSHKNGWKTSIKNYIDDCIKAEEQLNLKKLDCKLFRPPYGKSTKKQRSLLRKRGYTIVMWSVLSADFDTSITQEGCLKNVINNTKKGSIVVFHDSKKAEKNLRYTLPKILEEFNKKGYTFKRIETLKQ